MPLDKLKVGSKVRIISFTGKRDAYVKRLIALGLIPGTTFEIKRIAPFGDPIEITVRGYALSLRKSEANVLRIEEI